MECRVSSKQEIGARKIIALQSSQKETKQIAKAGRDVSEYSVGGNDVELTDVRTPPTSNMYQSRPISLQMLARQREHSLGASQRYHKHMTRPSIIDGIKTERLRTFLNLYSCTSTVRKLVRSTSSSERS